VKRILNNCGTEENKLPTSQNCTIEEEPRQGNIVWYIVGVVILAIIIFVFIWFFKKRQSLDQIE